MIANFKRKKLKLESVKIGGISDDSTGHSYQICSLLPLIKKDGLSYIISVSAERVISWHELVIEADKGF